MHCIFYCVVVYYILHAYCYILFRGVSTPRTPLSLDFSLTHRRRATTWHSLDDNRDCRHEMTSAITTLCRSDNLLPRPRFAGTVIIVAKSVFVESYIMIKRNRQPSSALTSSVDCRNLHFDVSYFGYKKQDFSNC